MNDGNARRARLTGLFVAAIAVLALVSGCSGAGRLENTRWKLVGWSVSSIDPAEVNITASFQDGQIGGTSAVNSYGGPVTVRADGGFLVGQLAATEMASADPKLNQAETIYLKLLAEARSYKVDADTLTLLDGNARELLVFSRVGK